MFPTLGLFASVRCPELSASNPGGPCKRNPCLFSHTAPAARIATAITSTAASSGSSTSKSNKRNGNEVIRSANGSASQDDSDGRPKKMQKQGSSSSSISGKPSQLFARDDEEGDVKPGKNGTKTLQQPSTAAASGTSRIGAPRAMGGSRSSAMIVTGSGKVIRRGPAPALQAKEATSTAHTATVSYTSSGKGKERATASDQSVHSSRPAAVSAFTSSVGPPRLPLNIPASYFPVATRNAMIKNIYHEFVRLYESLSPKKRHDMATEHALAQEAVIYGKNNKVCPA